KSLFPLRQWPEAERKNFIELVSKEESNRTIRDLTEALLEPGAQANELARGAQRPQLHNRIVEWLQVCQLNTNMVQILAEDADPSVRLLALEAIEACATPANRAVLA